MLSLHLSVTLSPSCQNASISSDLHVGLVTLRTSLARLPVATSTVCTFSKPCSLIPTVGSTVSSTRKLPRYVDSGLSSFEPIATSGQTFEPSSLNCHTAENGP